MNRPVAVEMPKKNVPDHVRHERARNPEAWEAQKREGEARAKRRREEEDEARGGMTSKQLKAVKKTARKELSRIGERYDAAERDEIAMAKEAEGGWREAEELGRKKAEESQRLEEVLQQYDAVERQELETAQEAEAARAAAVEESRQELEEEGRGPQLGDPELDSILLSKRPMGLCFNKVFVIRRSTSRIPPQGRDARIAMEVEKGLALLPALFWTGYAMAPPAAMQKEVAVFYDCGLHKKLWNDAQFKGPWRSFCNGTGRRILLLVCGIDGFMTDLRHWIGQTTVFQRIYGST